MKAYRNLADGDPLLEFLEADYTLFLLKLVDALFIRALSDQSYQSLDYMFLVQHLPPCTPLSELYLVVLELLLELHPPNAHHDDGPDADEFETETEN